MKLVFSNLSYIRQERVGERKQEQCLKGNMSMQIKRTKSQWCICMYSCGQRSMSPTIRSSSSLDVDHGISQGLPNAVRCYKWLNLTSDIKKKRWVNFWHVLVKYVYILKFMERLTS